MDLLYNKKEIVMAQYIDKDALVAEIKRRRKLVSDPILSGNDLMIGERNAYFNLLSFIDTLEVKEVDLEKHLKEDIDDVLFDLNGVAVKGATHYLTVEDVKYIAKHFYSLGMAASNKAQKGE